MSKVDPYKVKDLLSVVVIVSEKEIYPWLTVSEFIWASFCKIIGRVMWIPLSAALFWLQRIIPAS